jgi:hypothetical protein
MGTTVGLNENASARDKRIWDALCSDGEAKFLIEELITRRRILKSLMIT